MNYEEAEQYLFNIPRFTTKNEPEKTRAFLEEIGDFSNSIPTVHVAGTNGKGSVCAYLRAGLEANGLRVGVFTSPHLVDIRERFMIGDEMISKKEFTEVFNYVGNLVSEMRQKEGFGTYHPTFFEYLFFMAAVWFKGKRPDVVILEVGLGGRLDATNSIEAPKVSVITEIGLDHCEYLGETKELIAGEKAGIIKAGIPVIAWSKGEAYDEVIKAKAKEKKAHLVSVSKESIKNLETSGAGVEFSIQSLYDGFVKISLNTKALYQVENASLAFVTLEVLKKECGILLDIDKCAEGLFFMKWPGRMEKVKENLVIDGAHNEDGIKAFLETVKKDGCSKRAILYSAVSDKDIEKVSSMIIGSNLFQKYYVCRLSGYRAADIKRLEDAFKGAENVSFYESVGEGIGEMISEQGKDFAMYAAGSLYLVGEIKALIQEEKL